MSAGSNLAAFQAGYIAAKKQIINETTTTKTTVNTFTSAGRSVRKYIKGSNKLTPVSDSNHSFIVLIL